MRFIYESASPPMRVKDSELADAMERLAPLTWQETLAEFVLALAGRAAGSGRAEADATASALQSLRRVEYDALDAAARMHLLELLCDEAAMLPPVLDSLGERAAWLDGQPWSWEAAATLGRLWRLPDAQLPRVQPVGRDRHGRVYWAHQGVLWVEERRVSPAQAAAEAASASTAAAAAADAGEAAGSSTGAGASGAGASTPLTLRFEGAEQVGRVAAALSGDRGASERQLHFTLTRLLHDGLLGELSEDTAAADVALDGASPCTSPCPSRGRLPSPCTSPCPSRLPFLPSRRACASHGRRLCPPCDVFPIRACIARRTYFM